MKLILARHGETDLNELGIFAGQSQAMLTEKGREQARQLGEVLAPLQPRKIISSPLYRALETAQIATASANYEEWISLEPRLQEVGLGDFQGRTIEEVRELCVRRGLPEYKAMPFYNVHIMKRDLRKPLEERCGFEHLVEIDARLQRVLDQTIAREAQLPGSGPVILIAHCGVNAYLLEKILYGTCAINIDLRENGGHFPQRSDELSLVNVGIRGEVLQAKINVHLDNVVETYRKM